MNGDARHRLSKRAVSPAQCRSTSANRAPGVGLCPKRNIHPRKLFITARDVAFRLSVSESKVIHQGKGLEGLTVVRLGKNIRFILEEVEQLERELIEKARSPRQRLCTRRYKLFSVQL